MGSKSESGSKVDPWKCEDVLLEAARKYRAEIGYDNFFFNEGGFLVFSEFPGGIAVVARGFCGKQGEPRVIAEVYGALQSFESIGKDVLNEFLKMIVRVTGETLVSVGIGPNDELVLESYLPYSIVYAPDALKPELEFADFLKAIVTMYMMFGAWISVNILRAKNNKHLIPFDTDTLMNYIKEELSGTLELPGVLQL